MNNWKSMKVCPQCGANFKFMKKTGPLYKCGSLMHMIGINAGTLTSTGIYAINGSEIFYKWTDQILNKN